MNEGSKIAQDVERPATPQQQPVAKSGSYAKDVIKLASGTTAAQLLAILAAPIVTRLYAPEAYGVLALFTSLASIIILISCLRYELTIVLPKDDEDAVNLLGVSLMFVVVISSATAVMVLTLGVPLAQFLDIPELTPYLWSLPLFVLLGGTYQAFSSWSIRKKDFGQLSIANVLRSVSSVGTQLTAGTVGKANGGSLIGAVVFGQFTATIALAMHVWHDDAKLIRQSIRWMGMLEGMKRYKQFPLYGTWAALLNSISWQLPTFMLAMFFSTTVVGYYALGTRLMRIPMELIGQSVAQVFYQRASIALSDGNLAKVTEETYRYLVKLSLFPLLLLSLVGGDLFGLVFGVDWIEAGVYSQILAVWTCAWFISSPMSRLYSVLERQDFSLWINILIFVTRLLALAVGGYYANARLTIALFAASGILVYSYLSIAIMREAGVPLSAMVRPVVDQLLLFLPSGAIILGLNALNTDAWVTLACSALMVAIYYLYLAANEPQLRTSLNWK